MGPSLFSQERERFVTPGGTVRSVRREPVGGWGLERRKLRSPEIGTKVGPPASTVRVERPVKGIVCVRD